MKLEEWNLTIKDKDYYFNNRVELSYVTWDSDKTGIPVILIHGLTSDKNSWLTLQEDFLPEHPKIAIDLRGHGDSSPGNFDFSIDQVIADFEFFIQKHSFSQVIIIAHSMGTRIAIPFAIRHPLLVKALILEDIDLYPRDTITLNNDQIEILKNFKQIATSKEAIRKQLIDQLGYDKLSSREIIQNKIVLNGARQVKLKYHPYSRYLSIKHILSSALPQYVFVQLNQFKIPTLLLRASNQSSCSIGGLEQMKQMYPDLQVIEIPDSVHNIHKSNASAFKKSVIKFLSE